VVSGQPNLASIPSGLREIVAACLAKNPADRPALAALASMISRNGPAVAASPTSFWPGPLAEAIRQYQAESGYDMSFAMATHATTALQSRPREAANLAASQAAAQAAYQAATRAPASGRPQTPGGPLWMPQAPGGPPWMPQPSTAAWNQAAPAAAWPQGPAAPYQPAPGWSVPPASARPRIPRSVLTAVRLMYTGAAVSLVNVIVNLTAINQIKTAFETQHPLAQNAAQGVAALAAAAVVISGAVGIGLWLKLASASRKGRSWARTAGTILFGLDTIGLLGTLGRTGIPVAKTFGVLIWLIGFIAVIELWRRQSSDYFDSRRR
jgi:hypothetical protein